MYSQASASGGAGPEAGAGFESGQSQSGPKHEEDVVDADFEEVKDSKK